VIAVDTNILVYAHREDSPWHEAALGSITGLAEGRGRWAIPWPCLHEFLAIVTHPRIFRPPTPLSAALDQVAAWMESPRLVLLGESEGYWPEFTKSVQAARIAGPQVHDARIATVCAHHGIEELWSADRDFSRFPGVAVRNPLLFSRSSGS
jgi:toxin-antitoxin system PIN domain toxin